MPHTASPQPASVPSTGHSEAIRPRSKEASENDLPQRGTAQLARLAQAAQNSAPSRSLTSLQRRADRRTSPRHDGVHTQALTGLTMPPASHMDASRAALLTALSPPTQLKERVPGPGSDSSIIAQRAKTAALSPAPGVGYAQDSAMLTDMGMTARSMSHGEYAKWSGTFQCKMGLHGKAQVGNRTIVTQYRSAHDAMQFAGFFQRNKEKFAAGLVMAEAALTITAGILGITTGVATATPPIIAGSAVGLASGVVKLIRGIIMMHQADKHPNDKNQAAQAWIAGLRTIEAVVAGIAIAVGNPMDWKKIPAMFFVIAKTIRSIAMAMITKWKNEPKSDATDKKIAKAQKVAKIAHWFEVAALTVTGTVGVAVGATAEAADTTEALKLDGMVKAGGLVLGVGASKAIRASGALNKKPSDAGRPRANAIDEGQAPQVGRPRANAIDEGQAPQVGRPRANAIDEGQAPQVGRPRANAIYEGQQPSGRPRADAFDAGRREDQTNGGGAMPNVSI